MKSLLPLAAGLSLSFAIATAQAQTCANPIPINSNPTSSWLNFNSCSSGDYMDTQWFGSVYTPGRDVVYLVQHMPVSKASQPPLHFTLIPQSPSYDPAIFACTQCNALASCIDGHDDGGPGFTEQMSIGKQARPYYVIVDSTDPSYLYNCGPYMLNVMHN